MDAVIASARHGRERLLLCFAILQLLDFLTTMAAFSRGGSELNPILGSLIPFTGPVIAVLSGKLLLLWLAYRLGQCNWILYVGNLLYSAIVSWNLVLFLVA